MHKMLFRTMELGYTWGLIPLVFHGQNSKEDQDLVVADLCNIASCHNLGPDRTIYLDRDFGSRQGSEGLQLLWGNQRNHRNVRFAIICTNVAKTGLTSPEVGVVIGSGTHRKVSMDGRTGVSINAFQTLSKSHLMQHMGSTGRTDEGDHIVMMSIKQYKRQIRTQDSAQLDESDLSPMILRALVAGRPLTQTDSCPLSPRPVGCDRLSNEPNNRSFFMIC